MPDVEAHAGSYRLAYEEGGRALDAQERAVNELRSRAGLLIAAAAITTSFFGSRAVIGGPLTVAGWIAVAAFALVATTVLAVLWPWRDWEFSATPQNLIATYIETAEPATLAEIHRDIALHRSASWLSNATLLARLYVAFRAGSCWSQPRSPPGLLHSVARVRLDRCPTSRIRHRCFLPCRRVPVR